MGHGFTTAGGWLLDGRGRPTLLRGVNLSGSTKVPSTPPRGTHLGVPIEGWADVSFVGRPAPLDELDGHLERIAGWGLNCLRLLTTWEAIEHAGPGEYDEAYLDHYAEVVRRAGRHGLWVFVDPHQDVWSRWTGGDGAPFWCFDLAGLVPEHFVEAGAVSLDAQDWSENYQRVPVATMWTLFYGGDRFCPELAGVQQELQDRYIGAVAALAERIAHLDNVLGYDTLNEPGNGYIGRSARNLSTARRFFEQAGAGPWSPLEHLAAADGVTLHREDGQVLNPSGLSIWRHGCPWQRAGVWTLDRDGTPELADPDRFREIDGRRINPFADFHVPFIRRFRERLRAVHPDCLLFLEGSAWDLDTPWDDPDPLVVNARHWYDIVALGTRTVDEHEYRGTVDGEGLAAVYGEELGALATINDERMGGPPMLIGEFGVPYELNRGAAFATGDFSLHERLLHAMYDALDERFMSSTQWNYTPDNSHAEGDQWNHEDLSVYCAEDGGGRAVGGFSRPYARHSQGRPTAMRFDHRDGRFELVLDASSPADGPTEVVVPPVHYADGVVVDVSAGNAVHDEDAGVVRWTLDGPTAEARLTMRPA
jgi:glycosyl hydrolase family 5/cellulase (glycosyl hydrolase family 5)